MAQQINLYQGKFRKPRKPLSALEASLGMLLIIASLLSYGGLTWQKNEVLARDSQAIEREVQAQKSKVEQLTQEVNTRKKDAQLEAAATLAEQQAGTTREVVQMINSDTVGYTGGYSEQLRALARQAGEGMWLTGFTLSSNPGENQLRGRTVDAELVPAYLHRLNGEHALQGQRFDALTISTPAATATPAAGTAAATVATAANNTAFAAANATAVKFLEFSVGAAANTVTPTGSIR
jgi:hypothetical protein